MRSKKRILFLDTETTGLPASFSASPCDVTAWPPVVQIAGIVTGYDLHEKGRYAQIIKPGSWRIPPGMIHGISHERAMAEGAPAWRAFAGFDMLLSRCDAICAHNADFDLPVLFAAYLREGLIPWWCRKPVFCTQKQTTSLLKIPRHRGQRGTVAWKWPSLADLHHWCGFGEIENAHDALTDVEACARCFEFIDKTHPDTFEQPYLQEYKPEGCE